MKTLVASLIVSALVLSANAQNTHFNNFYSASSFTNPAFASNQKTALFTWMNRSDDHWLRTHLLQLVYPTNVCNLYLSYNHFNEGVLDFLRYNSLSLGASKRLNFNEFSVSLGLGANYQHTLNYPAVFLPSDHKELSLDLGGEIEYKNFKLGFSKLGIAITGYGRSQLTTTSLIHNKPLRKFEMHSALIWRSTEYWQKIDAYLCLRIRMLDLGTGFQSDILNEEYFSPRFFVGYTYKNLRCSYQFVNSFNYDYNYQWFQNELSLQFAFNTKGKDLSFLPF